MAAPLELRPAPPEHVPPRLTLPSAVRTVLHRLTGAARVTVVVNDPQRATATGTVLGLLAGGLAGRPCRALVATGSHHYPRRLCREFQRKVLSALPFAEIAWHDCRSRDLVPVPCPPRWRCHPWLLEADQAVLAIGSCEPHYFAGITGAHKTVTIGCAGYEDIRRNHAKALSPLPRPGRLTDNPVHEGIAAMVRSLLAARPGVLVVNLLQFGPDVLAAAAGPPLEALRRLSPLVRRAYVRTIPRPADALVLEVTGVLARSFYQADKGIKNSEWAVRDGGCVVLLAACPDGVGQDDFLRLLRHRTYDSVRRAVRREGYRLGDHKAVRLRYLTDCRGVRVFVVGSRLTKEETSILGLLPAGSVAEALAATGVDPAGGRVYRVADAGNTCVVVRARRGL